MPFYMRIALLNPTVLLRRPIVELARHLTVRGHQVQILTPNDPHSKWTKAHFQSSDINIVELPSKEFRSILWSIPYLRSWIKIWHIMKKVDIMQIWAPYYIVAILPLIYSFFIKRKSRPKIILTFDTIPGYSFKFENVQDFLMKIYHTAVGSWLFRRADLRTLYGSQLLYFARKAHLGNDFDVLPTGVDIISEQSPIGHSGKFIILFIGILNARKGLPILLRALEIIHKEGLDFSVNIVGDGPQREEYENSCDLLGIRALVKFIGRTSNVKEFYRQAHVLVLPSLGEGLPGVVMEAMSYSVPVISTDIPCLKELIPDSNIGILIPPGDARALANAFQELYNNESYRLSIAQNGRQYVEKYSWDKIAPKYGELYKTA